MSSSPVANFVSRYSTRRYLDRSARLVRNAAAIAALMLPSLAPAQQQSTTSVAGEIYKRASPAVVSIELLDDKGDVAKTGSGFLVSEDGKILTNFHVIAHSKRATVRLANKDAYDIVDVLDIDKRKDIALLKIKAVDLPFLTLGRSAGIEVGEPIYTLGNPLGLLENTLSEGIISGIRMGDGYRYFQISAPISHGSSGGPVFNSRGEVIAITAATLEEGQNLNFAVPIDYARGMMSATQTKPLSAIYEPEPAPEKPAIAAQGKSPAEEMRPSSLVYLEGKLKKWTKVDADRLLGEPLRHRDGRHPTPRRTSTPTTIRQICFANWSWCLIGRPATWTAFSLSPGE